MPDDIIEFLRENLAVEDRQPGDRSASEVAEEMGWTWQTACRKLRQMVSEGLATEHTVIGPNGCKTRVYRPVKREPPGG